MLMMSIINVYKIQRIMFPLLNQVGLKLVHFSLR